MTILTPPQVYQFLDTTSGGRVYEDGMLQNDYEFEDFLEAVGFINDVAEVAERLGHHPEITISYNHVLISTVTHDADDQITDLDTTLVLAIEELVE